MAHETARDPAWRPESPSALLTEAPPRPVPLALFGLGFRPFFLAAGIEAFVAMTVWLLVYWQPSLWPQDAMPAWLWHAHEMLFGFVAAAIAGFLLTAVPGWTGEPARKGTPLALLLAVWLVGRIAMVPMLSLPPGIAAVADLAFFPSLLAFLAPPLIRARKWRDLPFVPLLLTLFVCNLLFHLGEAGVVPMGELIGLGTAIDIVAIMIVVIGSRVIPQFTRSGLKREGIEITLVKRDWLDDLAVASVVLVLAADLSLPHSAAAGSVALLAALVQALRFGNWRGWRSVGVPLVWVLHVGYAWLIIGLLLKGLSLTFGLPFASEWLHAFTAGAFATMILAIMTRAALGHTGRALVAPRPVVGAYALATAAAVVRVFGPALLPASRDLMIAVAGISWLGAFAVFLAVYTPILVRPRIDGRTG